MVLQEKRGDSSEESIIRTYVSFLFIYNFASVYPEKTFACSCAGVTPPEAFEMSESVFVGNVLTHLK
jgi:hypothetical protein